jgi:hypothetical protein
LDNELRSSLAWHHPGRSPHHSAIFRNDAEDALFRELKRRCLEIFRFCAPYCVVKILQHDIAVTPLVMELDQPSHRFQYFVRSKRIAREERSRAALPDGVFRSRLLLLLLRRRRRK